LIDELQRCVRRGPEGRHEVDVGLVVGAVAADLPGARHYVDLACREALRAPGFLAPAAVVAEAYRRATGDSALVQRVRQGERAVRASGEPGRPSRRSP
jgi:Arc/MetJ family transcription regulator